MNPEYEKIRVGKNKYDIIGCKTGRKYNTVPLTKKEAMNTLDVFDGTMDINGHHTGYRAYRL